ncbi:hypothetical protein LR004_02325 [Candidatus Gracilibacteria bacterium]|nr:hypothetical protein [Candidatus Gracilibacteria bacterium]
MKKIVLLIISLSTVFTSSISVNAGEGTIEQMLNLPYAIEQIEYKLSALPEKTFSNSAVQKKYNEIKDINKVLTDEFYKKYKAGDIDYYTTKGIITNHKLFIYNTGKLFEYIEKKLENPNYVMIDENIIDSYSEMRININRIKYLYGVAKSNNQQKQAVEKIDYEVEYEVEYNGYNNFHNYNDNNNYYNNYNQQYNNTHYINGRYHNSNYGNNNYYSNNEGA